MLDRRHGSRLEPMVLEPKELHQIQAHLTKSPKPNLLNSLLRSLTQTPTPENLKKALSISTLILPISDHFTFTYALKACSLLPSSPLSGLRIHARILKSGLHSDLFIQNSLVSFYSSLSDLPSALRLFSSIAAPDVVSWTSIISALARTPGRESQALALFASMNVNPNPLTLVTVLRSCSQLRDLRLGRSVHGFGVRSLGNDNTNVILDNAVLDMYLSCGDFDSARILFDEMPNRDVVSWTTLVSGYAKAGRFEDAVGVFAAMRIGGEAAPNEATMVSVLSACASMAALRLGKSLHSYLYRSWIGVDDDENMVGNALINMYAKCGEVGLAVKVFDKVLPCKDLVSWCSIIGGMAVNGQVRAAVQLFAMMLLRGVRLDAVAFLAILVACCHAGMVDEGWRFFEAMWRVYGIEPGKEHFACLIDMSGRAGRLEEMEELVRRMPVEPNGHIWGTLLRAYDGDAAAERIGRRVVGGEMAVGGGTYALLSNMLAKAGKWEESGNVREQMRMRRIKKAAGCSWIEVHTLELG